MKKLKIPEKNNIYGELESGLLFLLTPDWLKGWEEDEIKSFEENEKEVNDAERNLEN